MERLVVLVVYFFHVFTDYIASGCPPVPGTVNTYYRTDTDTCYYAWPVQAVYNDAKSTCATNGLHLLQLETLDEQVWLNTQTSIQHWLGLSKKEGVWRWEDSGQVVSGTDTRWVACSSGNKAYKQTTTHWASTFSTSSYAVICEVGKSGRSCFGFRKFYLHKFTAGYRDTLRIIAPVRSKLESTVKCIKDVSFSGVRVELYQGICALLNPSAEYKSCADDATCYRIVDDSIIMQ